MAHPVVLRFGIPSLDRLICRAAQAPPAADQLEQIALEASGMRAAPNESISVCIIGPDGTGKSIFSLHLASRYAADLMAANDDARVLYVSTDLRHSMADAIWDSFGLNSPNARDIPFECPREPDQHFQLKLKQETPKTISEYLLHGASTCGSCSCVPFIDLAANTAGDDWGFVRAMISSLPPPNAGRHLLVIDAVEGFETLVGERDAFGEPSSRRARIAQIVRAASSKCHIVFTVEERRDDERLPEEFVADLVVRLRGSTVKNYKRRTVEIVKSRGQENVRGEHLFFFRAGTKSEPGERPNADDPPNENSYLHVLHSLHSRHRLSPIGRDNQQHPRYVRFGIPYLDDLLSDTPKTSRSREGTSPSEPPDTVGLQCGTATALIGDAGTKKSKLGWHFLSAAFRDFADELRDLVGKGKPALLSLISELESSWPDKADSLRTARLAIAAGQFAEVPANLADEQEGDSRPALRPMRTLADAAALLLELRFRVQNRLCAAVVLCTHVHWNIDYLICEVRKTLFDYPEPDLCNALESHLRRYTFARRMDIDDAPSPVLFHVLEQTVARAKRSISSHSTPTHNRPDCPTRIRLLIDDFKGLKHTYPDIREDPLFYPYLSYYLSREQLTTLIVETHAARRGPAMLEVFDTDLQLVVKTHIYTWRVPFFGENRIAITVAPSRDSVVRELREYSDGRLWVDPHFEMYRGLEEGKPRPAPLQIRLYEETEDFQKYFQDLEFLFSSLFTPVPHLKGVISPVSSNDYAGLRDLCNLQVDSRLEHTLVFQTDEFWAVDEKKALRDQRPYLLSEVTHDGEPDRVTDPFSVFQPTERSTLPPTRIEQFLVPGLKLDKQNLSIKEKIPIVPFVWDFGFLLCKENAWEAARSHQLQVPSGKKTVGNIWDGLPKALPSSNGLPESESSPAPPSWREFFAGCREVARLLPSISGVQPFDLSLVGPESLICLVLEVWGSEIDLATKPATHDQRFARHFSETLNAKRATSVRDLVEKHYRELVRSLFLIAAVLDLDSLMDPQEPQTPQLRRASSSAVAARVWYKTASTLQKAVGDEPLVPVRLPGNYSVRGDWYLAVAADSVSGRLAERALDLLSTRRANVERLRFGLGLPVRNLHVLDEPTHLLVTRDGQKTNVLYSELLAIAGPTDNAPPRDFDWIWRGDLRNYERQNVAWLHWILAFFTRLRSVSPLDKLNFIDNFEAYDKMLSEPKVSESFSQQFRIAGLEKRLLASLAEATRAKSAAAVASS